jgi:excisionase family DNA binding protein
MDTVTQLRPLLSLKEAAERLNVSERTIRRLIANRELRAARVGNQLRIDADQLEEWLRGRFLGDAA